MAEYIEVFYNRQRLHSTLGYRTPTEALTRDSSVSLPDQHTTQRLSKTLDTPQGDRRLAIMEPGRSSGHEKDMNVPAVDAADEDLWRRAVVEGSADVWGDLFARHHRAIYNFCFRRTGDWGVAEDLTSVVFLEAWRRRRSTRVETPSALPWLYGIATMLTRNHHRTLRRYRHALQRIPAAELGSDPAEQVAVRVDAQRRVAQIRQALRQLPQRDVDVLELAAAGLGIAEIAAALSVPAGTAKSRLARARDRLAGLAEQPRPAGHVPAVPDVSSRSTQ